MDDFLMALFNASGMLLLTASIVALVLHVIQIRSTSLRQWMLLGVMIQGVMLVRFPVELPVLSRTVKDSESVWNSIDSLALLSQDENRTTDGLWSSYQTNSENESILAIAHFDLGVVETKPARWDSDTIRGDLFAILAAVWATGFAGLIGVSIASYWKVCRKVSGLIKAPHQWQGQWQNLCAREGLTPPIMLVSRTMGPMLVRRPSGYALVVPRRFWKTLSELEREGVLLHELSHLTRRDVWRLLAMRWLAAVHWWNPAAWWCVRAFEEAVEWACDERLARQSKLSANGLASSLVRLVELNKENESNCVIRGIGVQCMATPPLTRRIKRLVQPSQGESKMKRVFAVSLLIGSLGISVIQFQLVSAAPQTIETEQSPPSDSGDRPAPNLRVLSPALADEIDRIVQRLDKSDSATNKLAALLDTGSGRIALAGALDQLVNQERVTARAEAIPRFVKTYFVRSDQSDRLQVKADQRTTVEEWMKQATAFHQSLDAMTQAMHRIGQRVRGDHQADQLAKRMLIDPQAALVFAMEEFDGKLDPVDRFLGEVFEKILVQRGNHMQVIPGLGDREQKQLERFASANLIAEKLRPELQYYAKEFATPDDKHRKLIRALGQPAMVAILSFQLAEDEYPSPVLAVDKLVDNLEKASRDTPDGLVIESADAWQHLHEILELSERAAMRVTSVRLRLEKIAGDLDTNDPMSARVATQLRSDVVAYVVAAQIPYAELDLSQQVSDLLMSVMDADDTGMLAVREDARDEVIHRAGEVLPACRRVRRYLRQVESMMSRIDEPDFAKRMGDSGSALLLREIRNYAETQTVDPIGILQRELLRPVEPGGDGQLTVRPDRGSEVDKLAERAQQLDAELKNDDF